MKDKPQFILLSGKSMYRYHIDHPLPPVEQLRSVLDNHIATPVELLNLQYDTLFFYRTLHGKTGELTTQVNNLHNTVAKIQAGGSVGASTGGGISRQEFNSMINTQNELKNVIYNMK